MRTNFVTDATTHLIFVGHVVCHQFCDAIKYIVLVLVYSTFHRKFFSISL